MAPAPDRATVIDPGKPGTPLPDIGTFEATPAFRAIQDGLGAYLASQGYVAEHPLLYVNETEDPYVYVRFEISTDGLGFIDTTFTYSPGVADQLNEIFEAYEVYAKDEPRTPYTSEAMMLGRPVHASIQALQTREMEETIDRIYHWQAVKEDRPKKSWRQRCRTIRAAKQRARIRGSSIFPSFGFRSDDYTIVEDCGAPFNSLPLNWRHGGEIYWTNWCADPAVESAAEACIQAWEKFVAPRLVHASRDGGTALALKTWLSSSSDDEGGYGELGGEWRPLDRLYWSMKMSYEMDRYWEEWKYSVDFEDSEPTLYAEFRNIAGRLYRLTDKWLEAHDLETPAPSVEYLERQATLMLNAEDFRNAALLYMRQTAVAAYRMDVRPSPKWRQPGHQNPHCLYPPPSSVIIKQLKNRIYKNDY